MFAPEPLPHAAITDALQICVIDGEVVFLGGRLGFSMTPTAAAETNLRLAKLLTRPPEPSLGSSAR
ncbi:MAG TPA: hypothetical protein VGH86_03290 [Phenylobacterium sp.]|jgi:hypothetical protein